MGTVESGSELGADAFGQFGGTQALDGVLGHFALPLRGDGGRVDERDPVDDLGAEQDTGHNLQNLLGLELPGDDPPA